MEFDLTQAVNGNGCDRLLPEIHAVDVVVVVVVSRRSSSWTRRTWTRCASSLLPFDGWQCVRNYVVANRC